MTRHSLQRRIIVAFTLMTMVVAGLFSIGLLAAIDQAEIDLVSESLERQLEHIRSSVTQGAIPHPTPGTRYFSNGTQAYRSWPEWLSTLPDGFHEVFRESDEFHVLIRTEGETRYALVLSLDEFEQRETFIKTVTAIGFLASVVAALGLGTLTARRVISPVIRLSRQVQHRDQLLPIAPPLAPDYAQDEVGRLASAFDHTLSRLREAFERERMFTSDVSHELRTPLMVIASSCELLTARGIEDDHARSQIERIQRSCAEMQELVETFLRLSRAPAGQNGTAGSTLHEVAVEQLRRWGKEAAIKGLDLQLKIEAETPDLYPTPLLRAVLSNLLRNALHYTDCGFVRLTLCEDGFSVIDSGVGIPTHDRERIFAPFTRGDASRGDGSGIGLSLVQRICSRQGWQIRLTERPEGGCEFHVRLRSA